MWKTKEEVSGWLNEMEINNYTINENLKVDVAGDVNLDSRELTEIPVQFGKVSGNFSCHINELTSLKGSPEFVGGDFGCCLNQLTSLQGCPEFVGGEHFDYAGNNKFKNELPNKMNFEQIKKYNESEKLAEKLEKELPKQDDFRAQVDRKQLEELHAQITEMKKTVVIPDTYITETVKPKNEIKDSIIRMDPSQIHKVIEDAKNSLKEPELKSNVVSIAEVKNDMTSETQLTNAATRPHRRLKL